MAYQNLTEKPLKTPIWGIFGQNSVKTTDGCTIFVFLWQTRQNTALKITYRQHLGADLGLSVCDLLQDLGLTREQIFTLILGGFK